MTELVKARDLRPGAYLDLEGDEFATTPPPDADARALADHELTVSTFEFEMAEVEEVEHETEGCVVVHTSLASFACPPDHRLRVEVDR